jgi:inner membrane protein
MDNITHTLAGAALGEAGLKKVTGLGMATLMIAANIPDVDALIIPFGDQLPFRRGWTHGPVGLLVLPALLAATMLGFDRLQTRWRRRPASRAAVRFVPLLALAYLGALTHPFLDWLNTYGIRFLMPFSHEWYYGDAVFIIDPWIWLMLGLGVFLARRRQRGERANPRRPAVVALVAVTLYIGVMVGGSRVASEAASREIEAHGAGPVERIMAGPVPINPLRREIIWDRGADYGTGMLTFRPSPEVNLDPDFIPRNDDHPLALRAIEEPEFQRFLYWSRFPFFEIEEGPAGATVHVGDLRFSRRAAGGWASRSVEVGQR